MTITLGFWLIPVVLTLFGLAAMFRPYEGGGDFDFGAIFRVLWLLPIAFVWVVYFAILALTK